MTDTQTLEAKLKDIAVRKAELDERLAREPAGTYVRQELESELAELIGLRRSLEYKIAAAKAGPPARDERLERYIQAEVNSRRQGLLEWIEVLERQGDHRQARLWRRQMLDLREEVEREFGR